MYNEPNKKSILDSIFEEEFKKFTEQTVATETEDDTLYDTIFSNYGAVISPINRQTNTFNDLVLAKGNIAGKNTSILHEAKLLFNEVTDKMLTLDGTYTIKEALPIVEKFISKAGRNFYGVLLRSATKKSIIINPYHPLAAVNILTNSTYKNTKFKIILYFYPNRSKLDKIFETSRTTKETVKTSIDKILRMTKPFKQGHQVFKELSKEIDKSAQTVCITRSIKTNVSEDPNMNSSFYIISHQLLTRGMIAPYYGSSILAINPSSGGLCAHISPFYAANVSRGSPTNYNTAEYNGICTGNQPKNTFKGLSSLNHANLSSPLNRHTIRSGALLYTDMCIDITRELYKKANYISDYTPIASDLSVNKEHIKAIKANRQKFAEQLVNSGYTIVEAAIYIKQLQGIINETSS